MTGPFTVDASVVINAFNPSEAGHSESQRFLAHLQSEAIPIIAPTLLLPEVAATISRGIGDPELAQRFTMTLAALPHLVLVNLDINLARRTVDIASQHRLRGSDAVYATVALQFGSKLITLDREQRERVAEIIVTQYPTEALGDLE